MRSYGESRGNRSFEFFLEERIDPKDTPDTWDMKSGAVIAAHEVGEGGAGRARKRRAPEDAEEKAGARAAALRELPGDGPNARALKAYVAAFDAAFSFDADGALDRSAAGVARIAAFARDPEIRAVAAGNSGAPVVGLASGPAPERIDDASLGRLFGAFYPAYGRACRILGVGVHPRLVGRGWTA